jgi:hypothetical protein
VGQAISAKASIARSTSRDTASGISAGRLSFRAGRRKNQEQEEMQQMARKPEDNVVLTQPAARALRDEFIGWQCRIRQLASRQAGGRPSAGMRPRVTTPAGDEMSPGMVMLIVEAEPEASTTLFRYQYLKTQDPTERYDKILEILQASYFQRPAMFSDVMTALFGAESSLASRLLAHGRCVLEFAEYAQAYRIPCTVAALAENHRFHQATYWHNRMFNPNLPGEIQILSFTPDWTHAVGFQTEPELEE